MCVCRTRAYLRYPLASARREREIGLRSLGLLRWNRVATGGLGVVGVASWKDRAMAHFAHSLIALGLWQVLVGHSLAETATSHDPQGARNHSAHVGGHAAWCARHVVRREYRQAIEDCDEALSQDPLDADALSNRGAAYLMIAEVDRAIADVEAALRVNSSDATLHYNRALLHIKKGEYAEAVAEYTETIRLSPRHVFAYNNRGIALEFLGERDRAIADYRKVLELAPTLGITRQNLRRLGVE